MLNLRKSLDFLHPLTAPISSQQSSPISPGKPTHIILPLLPLSHPIPPNEMLVSTLFPFHHLFTMQPDWSQQNTYVIIINSPTKTFQWLLTPHPKLSPGLSGLPTHLFRIISHHPLPGLLIPHSSPFCFCLQLNIPSPCPGASATVQDTSLSPLSHTCLSHTFSFNLKIFPWGLFPDL